MLLLRASTSSKAEKKKDLRDKAKDVMLMPPRVMVGDKNSCYPFHSELEAETEAEATWLALSTAESDSQAMSVDGSSNNLDDVGLLSRGRKRERETPNSSPRHHWRKQEGSTAVLEVLLDL